MNLTINAETKMELTDFKNPFQKNQISRVSITIYNRQIYFNESRNPTIDFDAIVNFKNGNTEGQQKITADNFQNLIEKVNAFIKSLD